MAAEVKILIEGCTNADAVAETGEEKTQPTITLIRDENIVMVVDPGILEDQKVLVNALKKEKLTVKDVNVVCITHSHIDHYRNAGMFPNAKTLEFFGLWKRIRLMIGRSSLAPISKLSEPQDMITQELLFL